MVLTFRNNQFYLEGTQSSAPPSDYWEKQAPGTWSTSSLKAAALFRHLSDDIAKKVFNRAFVKHFEVPELPQLLSELNFLDPHQVEGISWILTRSRSYLAHTAGAGKTAQAVIASCLVNDYYGKTLFIVPPSLAVNWEREIRAFAPRAIADNNFSIGVVGTSGRQTNVNWNADFVICPDSMITKPWVYRAIAKMKLKFLAVDEASRFKDPTAQRSKVLYGGRDNSSAVHHGVFQRARHTVFLDGSPMPNRPMELYAPSFALNPESIDCLSQHEFGLRYCGATLNERGAWEYNHSSNEEELKAKLQKDFMHVVGEDQLNHPERRRSILFMSEDVRSPKQKTWERQHLGSVNMSEIDEDASRGDIAIFRRELGARKINWVAGYVSSRLQEKNESILLFCWHREVAEGLALALEKFKPGLIIGGTKKEYREAYFERFQKGETRIIIGNIQAMGRGHNLQRADRVIFAEYSWTDESNKQCEARAARRGRDQHRAVRCEYIVVPHSMDEVVLQAVFTKQKRVTRVIG